MQPFFVLCIVPKGVRKDRIRIIRRDKRRPANSSRERSAKDVEQKTAPPQDRRKHHSSSGGGGKRAVPGISPEQVQMFCLLKGIHFRISIVQKQTG